MYRRNDGDQCM